MIFLSGWWWWHDRSACETLGGISNHSSAHKKTHLRITFKNHIYNITFMVHFKFKRRITQHSNNEQHQQCILTWTDLSRFRRNVSFSMNFKRDDDNTHCTHSSTIKHKHFFLPLRGRFEKITDWHRHNNNANVKCKHNNSEQLDLTNHCSLRFSSHSYSYFNNQQQCWFVGKKRSIKKMCMAESWIIQFLHVFIITWYYD